MCNTGGIPSREALEFASAVRASFGWLAEYGFVEVEANATLVRYESASLRVVVYHGRSSYQVGVEVGRRDSEDRYSLSELMRMADPERAERSRPPVVYTAPTVATAVAEEGRNLRDCGEAVLSGQSSPWSELQAQRKAWSEEFAREVLVEQVRPAAAEAFRQRRYEVAVRELERIEDELSRSEQLKLDYARKRVAERDHSDPD